MFVYFYWPKNGHQQVQAFHKQDKAAEYVINQIEALAMDQGRSLGLYKKKIPVRARPNPANPLGVGGIEFDIDVAQPNQPAGHVFYPPPAQPRAVAVPAGDFLINGGLISKDDSASKEEEKIPVELEKLRLHMDEAKKNKSFGNAVKAIELYEDFAKYHLGSESSIHTLQDIKVVAEE